ncbi:MAG: hypothetical protein M0Z85_07600 [Gammaproteobacteria bacterium]|nr:hypothetical protein [Gammaproteobacteria bacterium]
MKMKTYNVRWCLGIDAASPREAAMEAHQEMQRPGMDLSFFEVDEEGRGETTQVDLTQEPTEDRVVWDGVTQIQTEAVLKKYYRDRIEQGFLLMDQLPDLLARLTTQNRGTSLAEIQPEILKTEGAVPWDVSANPHDDESLGTEPGP